VHPVVIVLYLYLKVLVFKCSIRKREMITHGYQSITTICLGHVYLQSINGLVIEFNEPILIRCDIASYGEPNPIGGARNEVLVLIRIVSAEVFLKIGTGDGSDVQMIGRIDEILQLSQLKYALNKGIVDRGKTLAEAGRGYHEEEYYEQYSLSTHDIGNTISNI